MNHADRRSPIGGVMSLLLTPFDADRSIDWAAYDAYVAWQLEQEPHGLFAVCGSSEMKWLALDERIELARRAVIRAGGLPVLATANLEPDLSKHRDEISRMADAGVAGVVLVPPPGLGAEPERLEAYFAALTEASPVPVFLYEWPQVQPHLLSPESFGRLANDCGVAGIKDTTCTMEGITAKIQAAPGAVVFQANTPFAIESIKAGAKGLMAVTSTCCSDLVVRFWRDVRATGRDEAAASLHRELVFLDAVLGRAYPAGAKYLVQRRGLPFPLHTRWPVSLRPQDVRALDAWFSNLSRI